MDSQLVLEMFHMGALTTYPLAVCSVIVLAVAIERWWRYRGIDKQSRALTRSVVDALGKRDLSAAVTLCQATKTPLAEIFRDALAWKNIALEDLGQILATTRAEVASDLRKGLWVLGTIGSLAPFIGLFGTVVGIMKAFQQIAEQGSGGFDVVAAGISEALIATAVGLGVAIVALAFYNWLNVRVGAISQSYTRSCERLVQALLYVEASGSAPAPPSDPGNTEAPHGHPLPA